MHPYVSIFQDMSENPHLHQGQLYHYSPDNSDQSYQSSESKGEEEMSFVLRNKTMLRTALDKNPIEAYREKIKKNQGITENCNYGFDFTTIAVYHLILKKFLEAYHIKNPLPRYSSQGSGLIRLNDQIPMDFGGFSPAIDTELFDIPGLDNFSNGQIMLEALVQHCMRIENESDRKEEVDSLEKARMPKRFKTQLQNFVTIFEYQQDMKILKERILQNIQSKYNQCMQTIKNNNQEMGMQPEILDPTNDLNSYVELLSPKESLTPSKQSHSKSPLKQPQLKKENQSNNEEDNHKSSSTDSLIQQIGWINLGQQKEKEVLVKCKEEEKSQQDLEKEYISHRKKSKKVRKDKKGRKYQHKHHSHRKHKKRGKKHSKHKHKHHHEQSY